MIFTEREKEVIGLMRFGYTNAQIAKKINRSVDMVKFHVTQILKKTNARNRVNAIFILTREGYFDDCVNPIFSDQNENL